MSDFNNPFADPTEKSDPFTDPSVQQARAGGATASDNFNPFERGAGSDTKPAVLPTERQPQQQPQYQQPPPAYSSSAQQRVSSEELERRQRELEAKARELERREEEQRRREQLAASGGQVNNWPPLPSFCPIGPCFYQDFEMEIPQEFRRIVKLGYYLWMAHAVVLLLNIIGTLAYFCSSDQSNAQQNGTVFGVSILVCVVFTPVSFACWFRPMYKAFKSDSSFNYFLFFAIFFVQFAVLVIQCLGINYLGSCGWINGISMLKINLVTAIIMLTIAGLFTALAVIDILLLLRVHSIYRSSGASFAKAKQEFSTGVMANDTVRGVAADAAAASARSAFSGGGGSRY